MAETRSLTRLSGALPVCASGTARIADDVLSKSTLALARLVTTASDITRKARRNSQEIALTTVHSRFAGPRQGVFENCNVTLLAGAAPIAAFDNSISVQIVIIHQ